MIRNTGLLAILFTFGLFAAPVATLTTGGHVKVNGVVLPTTGAPTWPVNDGDEIATAGDPAILTFSDGTRITIGKDSLVKLKQCDRSVLQFSQGELTYKMAQGPKTQICALGHPVSPAALAEGNISIDNEAKVFLRPTAGAQPEVGQGGCSCEAPPPAWLTSKKKAALIILGASGAAVTGAAIAVTRPSDRSPSK